MQMKVLVIDDDREMTELLKMSLDQDYYEVLMTQSGPDGIELAHKEQPDVILVDLFIPDFDGLQVCRDIRKFSSVPILVLSAINKPELVAQALDAGADDFLIKPIKNSMLVANLKKIARRTNSGGYDIKSRSVFSH